MYAKTCAIVFIGIWFFNASLAVPAPEPEPEAQPDRRCGSGCGDGCRVTKVQAVPASSNIPIKIAHKILSDNGCCRHYSNVGWSNGGCGCGGGWISGWNGVCGGWGNGWEGGGGDCVITRIHLVPVTTHIPIKTTHRVARLSEYGSNARCGTLAGYCNGCERGQVLAKV